MTLSMLRRYNPIHTTIRIMRPIKCYGFYGKSIILNIRDTKDLQEYFNLRIKYEFKLSEIIYKELTQSKIFTCIQCNNDIKICLSCSIRIRIIIDHMINNNGAAFYIDKIFIDCIKHISQKYNLYLILSGADELSYKFIYVYNKGKLIYNKSRCEINLSKNLLNC